LRILEISSQLAAILTFIGAAYGYGAYRWKSRKKLKRLEDYLKRQKINGKGANSGFTGKHSVLHLMRHVGLTEAEILQASFDSKHIKRYTLASRETGMAQMLLFGYKKDPHWEKKENDSIHPS